MNPTDENRPAAEDHRFDLLVDNELSEAARRELLCGLDDEPGAWRRCALAFLEEQAWRQELGQSAEASPRHTSTVRRKSWSWFSGPAGTVLAMAGSFMVALLLGWALQGTWRTAAPASGPPLDAMVAEKAPAEGSPLDGPAGHRPSPAPEHPEDPAGTVRMVQLPGVDGEGMPIRLPAVEGEQFRDDWLESLPAPMSPKILERLREAGLEVRQHRELLPLRMRDGRRLVVPVDNVDIRFVRSPTL